MNNPALYGLFKDSDLKKDKDHLGNSWADLSKALTVHNHASTSAQFNEIREISSELIRLKGENVLDDEEFAKIIAFVFSNYIEARVDLLLNEKIEHTFNNMLLSFSHGRR